MKIRSLILCLASLAGVAVAGPVFSTNNVILEDGQVRLAPTGQVLYEEEFRTDNGAWKIMYNYENLLKFERGEYGGRQSLQITYVGPKGTDTAWELRSGKFRGFAAGGRVLIRMEAAGNVNMIAPRGHNDMYHNAMQWLDKDGKVIGESPFGFASKSLEALQSFTELDVPENAVAASLRIGADSPNVNAGRLLALYKIAVMAVPRKAVVYVSEGSFISNIRRIRPGDMIAWEGECPAGTELRFQISTAPTKNGIPGEWTPFGGPDGTEKSYYGQSGSGLKLKAGHAWARYKAILVSGKNATPVLKSVDFCGTRDMDFNRNLPRAPELEALTPHRSLNPRVPVSFRLFGETVVDWTSLKAELDGVDITAKLQIEGDRATFVPDKDFQPLPIAPNPENLDQPYPGVPIINLHCCRIQVRNILGVALDTSFYFSIGETPTTNVSSIRDDGCVLLDGKPFFPIGIYAVCKREFNGKSFDKAFSDLKANGFNTAHTYGSARDANFKDFIDTAAKYGFKVYVASGSSANCTDVAKVLHSVIRDRNHPALMSWYLADDTATYVPAPLLSTISSAVRAVDPIHFTVQADGVGQNYDGYGNATDGFLPELYPIRIGEEGAPGVQRIVTEMKNVARELERCGKPARTVWAIVQYFDGWGWSRFPTFAELRAMTYLCIIHGVNGMTWYTYGGFGKNRGVTATPETWKNITTVSRELASLQDVFVERTGKQPAAPKILAGPAQDSEGNNSLSILLKEHDGKKYLFAASSVKDAITAQITIPGAKTAKTLFEERQTLSLNKGVITDQFVEYGVHIYVIE